MTIYLYYFLIFSFFGWMLEVAYAGVKCHRFVNRGFVLGPVCPIYGVCAMLLRLCLLPLTDRWILLFLAAFGLATVLELATGFLMDSIFATKWWDYSTHRFNIGGYVCLRFSLYWGVLSTALVKLMFPVLDFIFGLVPLLVWQIVLWTLFAVLLVDLGLSVAAAFHWRVEMRLLEETRRALTKGSDTIGKGVYRGTAKLEEKYHVLSDKSARLLLRFLDAFPTMRVRGVDIRALRERVARRLGKGVADATCVEDATPDEEADTPMGDNTAI